MFFKLFVTFLKIIEPTFFYVGFFSYISLVIIVKMKKNKKDKDIDGYNERHLAALIRRKMIQKDHGDKSKYNKKDKSWKKDIDQSNDEN